MAKLEWILDRYELKTLEVALARRRVRDKRLAARRRELEEELGKLDAITGGRGLAGRLGERPARKRKPSARSSNKITLADVLERLLKARKKPTNYRELTDAIVKRRLYRTKSKNLLPTVMVTMTRDNRFKRLKPGVFALR